MSTWNMSTVIAATPDEVIDLLTDPAAASRWSPVAFEVENLESKRLSAGERARLTGSLAGLRVAFDLEVHAADGERLSLSARGPIGMDVLYELSAEGDGACVNASVTVHPGRGITGRVLARATDALLAGGALRAAITRIAAQAVPAEACLN
jgi:Polyketide cyclase / dehydrase and lipid transport